MMRAAGDFPEDDVMRHWARSPLATHSGGCGPPRPAGFLPLGCPAELLPVLPHDRRGRFEAHADGAALNGELPTASQFSEAP